MKTTRVAVRTAALAAVLLGVTGCPGGGTPDGGAGGGGGSGGGGPDGSTEVPGGQTIATVGADGGRVVADYGRVAVTFPAGALAAPTTVKITPVPGTAPGGFGSAYQIDLGGAALAKPAAVELRYHDAELKPAAAAGARLAFRDSGGVWNLLTKTAHDPVAKTLTAQTTHFSDWAPVVGWTLAPAEGAVKVGKALPLLVKHCWPSPLPTDDVVPLVNECQPGTATRTAPVQVNGIPGGNSSVGTVTDNVTTLNYTAPAALPAPGLDPITVDVSVGIDADGTPQTLSSHLVVYDTDVYAFDITLELAQSATVPEGTSGGSRSKSWNQRLTHTGIIQKSPLGGWRSVGPVVMNLGVSDSEMQNEGSTIVHYQSLTNPALASFTNAEAAGGAPFAVELTELDGKPSHLKLPKDASGAARCTMTVTGNGQDDIYPYNCTFSGYPSTFSFQETIDLDGAAVFDHGRQQLKVKLCPSDCSPTPGHSTLTWSFQRIVSQ